MLHVKHRDMLMNGDLEPLRRGGLEQGLELGERAFVTPALIGIDTLSTSWPGSVPAIHVLLAA